MKVYINDLSSKKSFIIVNLSFKNKVNKSNTFTSDLPFKNKIIKSNKSNKFKIKLYINDLLSKKLIIIIDLPYKSTSILMNTFINRLNDLKLNYRDLIENNDYKRLTLFSIYDNKLILNLSALKHYTLNKY